MKTIRVVPLGCKSASSLPVISVIGCSSQKFGRTGSVANSTHRRLQGINSKVLELSGKQHANSHYAGYAPATVVMFREL
jgi:hypothetical protein